MSLDRTSWRRGIDAMRVRKNNVVTLRYTLFDRDSGEMVEYRDELVYLHGGYEDRLPKLQHAVEGLNAHERAEIDLTSEEAFGPYDPNLRITDAAENFPAEAHKTGVELEGHTPEGTVLTFRVVKVEDGQVTVDANHPLAGRNLRFKVEVKDVRAATENELAAGHALRQQAPAVTAPQERH